MNHCKIKCQPPHLKQGILAGEATRSYASGPVRLSHRTDSALTRHLPAPMAPACDRRPPDLAMCKAQTHASLLRSSSEARASRSSVGLLSMPAMPPRGKRRSYEQKCRPGRAGKKQAPASWRQQAPLRASAAAQYASDSGGPKSGSQGAFRYARLRAFRSHGLMV